MCQVHIEITAHPRAYNEHSVKNHSCHNSSYIILQKEAPAVFVIKDKQVNYILEKSKGVHHNPLPKPTVQILLILMLCFLIFSGTKEYIHAQMAVLYDTT